ncbi:MAG TPA: isocitrate lyase/phosphoenolpyruvate mutase family protein [Anaeromyxobacteraceae bacterium]|nr:isocitrate lyase/phosphoenolpyruvate mutase family protein [Anaeromyxobacteraceae bacterium]
MTALRDKAEALRQLHAGPGILVLPNAWDVASARLFAQAGAAAIATSSAGVAHALGYADGQRISRAEMLDMVRRIAAAVELPVSADVESGYGATPHDASSTARGVLAAGAVGLNLEDTAADGTLLPLDLQVARVKAVRAAAEQERVPLVLNGRTDAFAAPGVPEAERYAEAARRANAYLAAGADCAFVPFTADREVIARLAREVKGPLNVLGTPAAPPVAELERLGVRRVSVGSGLARAAWGHARRAAEELLRSGTYGAMGATAIPYAEMQRLFGAD